MCNKCGRVCVCVCERGKERDNMCCACEAWTNALRKKLIKVMDKNAKAAEPHMRVCACHYWPGPGRTKTDGGIKALNQWNNVDIYIYIYVYIDIYVYIKDSTTRKVWIVNFRGLRESLMCIRRGKQHCDWDDSNFKLKQKVGCLADWLPGWLTVVFDGSGCLKWFSGDGSSVWCQWDKGDALEEELGGNSNGIELECYCERRRRRTERRRQWGG